MDRIRQKLFTKIEGLVLNIGSKRSKWRQWYIQQKDDSLGREMVGFDKFGNRYYQYYSFHGLPTKRMVMYKFFSNTKFNVDPHFLDWLNRREMLPPSPDELEKMYLEHDAFVARAIDWDHEQIKMIKDYKEKKKQMDLEYAEEEKKLLEQSGSKQPPQESQSSSKWIPDPSKGKGSEENELVAQSTIDSWEKQYYEEYQKVMAKDDSKSKDFNKLAYDDMKRARYFFEYMRTQERLYQYEQKKLQKDKEKQQSELQFQEQKKEVLKNVERQKEILNQDSVKRFNQKVEQKSEELSSKRYEQFREQFDDVFEVMLEKKNDVLKDSQKL